MPKIEMKMLQSLFKYAFKMGLKRTTTLPDKILQEELDEWIKKNLEQS